MSMVGFQDGYCDVAYADSLLGSQSPWVATTIGSKEDSLQWTRLYIENTYNVPVEISDLSITDGLKSANAILANENLKVNVFDAAKLASPEKGLTEATVQATPVKSTKKYDANITNTWVDPYPHITAIMKSEGYRLSKGGLVTTPVIRR